MSDSTKKRSRLKLTAAAVLSVCMLTAHLTVAPTGPASAQTVSDTAVCPPDGTIDDYPDLYPTIRALVRCIPGRGWAVPDFQIRHLWSRATVQEASQCYYSGSRPPSWCFQDGSNDAKRDRFPLHMSLDVEGSVSAIYEYLPNGSPKRGVWTRSSAEAHAGPNSRLPELHHVPVNGRVNGMWFAERPAFSYAEVSGYWNCDWASHIVSTAKDPLPGTWAVVDIKGVTQECDKAKENAAPGSTTLANMPADPSSACWGTQSLSCSQGFQPAPFTVVSGSGVRTKVNIEVQGYRGVSPERFYVWQYLRPLPHYLLLDGSGAVTEEGEDVDLPDLYLPPDFTNPGDTVGSPGDPDDPDGPDDPDDPKGPEDDDEEEDEKDPEDRDPGVTIKGHPVVVEEGGDPVKYYFELDSKPTADVKVDISIKSIENASITWTNDSYTVSPDDWDQPNYVTITAQADSDTQNGTAVLAHAVTSADPKYEGIAAEDVTVHITEYDFPDMSPVLDLCYGYGLAKAGACGRHSPLILAHLQFNTTPQTGVNYDVRYLRFSSAASAADAYNQSAANSGDEICANLQSPPARASAADLSTGMEVYNTTLSSSNWLWNAYVACVSQSHDTYGPGPYKLAQGLVLVPPTQAHKPKIVDARGVVSDGKVTAAVQISEPSSADYDKTAHDVVYEGPHFHGRGTLSVSQMYATVETAPDGQEVTNTADHPSPGAVTIIDLEDENGNPRPYLTQVDIDIAPTAERPCLVIMFQFTAGPSKLNPGQGLYGSAAIPFEGDWRDPAAQSPYGSQVTETDPTLHQVMIVLPPPDGAEVENVCAPHEESAAECDPESPPTEDCPGPIDCSNDVDPRPESCPPVTGDEGDTVSEREGDDDCTQFQNCPEENGGGSRLPDDGLGLVQQSPSIAAVCGGIEYEFSLGPKYVPGGNGQPHTDTDTAMQNAVRSGPQVELAGTLMMDTEIDHQPRQPDPKSYNGFFLRYTTPYAVAPAVVTVPAKYKENRLEKTRDEFDRTILYELKGNIIIYGEKEVIIKEYQGNADPVKKWVPFIDDVIKLDTTTSYKEAYRTLRRHDIEGPPELDEVLNTIPYPQNTSPTDEINSPRKDKIANEIRYATGGTEDADVSPKYLPHTGHAHKIVTYTLEPKTDSLETAARNLMENDHRNTPDSVSGNWYDGGIYTPDGYVFYSLVPSFRKMSEEKKYTTWQELVAEGAQQGSALYAHEAVAKHVIAGTMVPSYVSSRLIHQTLNISITEVGSHINNDVSLAYPFRSNNGVSLSTLYEFKVHQGNALPSESTRVPLSTNIGTTGYVKDFVGETSQSLIADDTFGIKNKLSSRINIEADGSWDPDEGGVDNLFYTDPAPGLTGKAWLALGQTDFVEHKTIAIVANGNLVNCDPLVLPPAPRYSFKHLFGVDVPPDESYAKGYGSYKDAGSERSTHEFAKLGGVTP